MKKIKECIVALQFEAELFFQKHPKFRIPMDLMTLIIFIIVIISISGTVWIPALLGVIFKNAYLISAAGVVWAWWMFGPASPFTLICIVITLIIRKVIYIFKHENQTKIKK